MISLFLIIFAAICCATYQVLDRYFFESRFKKLPQQFWYPGQSWKVAPQIFGYRIDAWHLLQSAMVISFTFACLVYEPIVKLEWKGVHWADLGIYGFAWNIPFSLFLNIIWRKK